MNSFCSIAIVAVIFGTMSTTTHACGDVPDGTSPVTVTAYPMDNLCIDRGTLLDAQNVLTLQSPELHSVYCLIDVGICYDSGYALLKPPVNEGGNYTVWYQMPNASADLKIAAETARTDNGVTAGLKLTATGYPDTSGNLFCVNFTVANTASPTTSAPTTAAPVVSPTVGPTNAAVNPFTSSPIITLLGATVVALALGSM